MKLQQAVEHRLIGQVDQVDEVAITGWLANLDDPGRLETLIFVGSCGGVLRFHACHFRHDVCAWLDRWGRFGFVVPYAALSTLQRPLTLRDRTGRILARRIDVGCPEGPSAQTGRPATIYLHIPKTAGTSLRVAMTTNLKPWEWLHLYPGLFGVSASEFTCLPAVQRDMARLVSGHVHFGIGRHLGRRSRYVTFVRDPVARLRSHVAHHARAGTVFIRQGAATPLKPTVEEGLDDEFDNLMVRYLAGLTSDVVPLGGIQAHHVDLALSNIQEHFAVAATIEEIDRHRAALSSLLGVDVPVLGFENVATAPVHTAAGQEEIDWDRVARRNDFDRLLYTRLAARPHLALN